MPHRHEFLGSRYPHTAVPRDNTGIPALRYRVESHASRLPESVEITIHTRIPPLKAAACRRGVGFVEGT
jgi:hypothetical protein